MRFSVCLPTCFEGLVYPIPFATPRDFVRLGRLCEELGYDGVWGNDHITTQTYVRDLFPGLIPNFYEVFVTLSAVACATTRIQVGTALAVLPMRDPVYLAKQSATLDQLSDGRFVLGVGLGAYREEFNAWAPRRREARRAEIFDEGLEAVRRLLTERRASFDGDHFAFEGIEMAPKPLQNPFPVYVGGHSLEAIERAARYGRGWLPGWRPLDEMRERIDLLREKAIKCGRNPDDIEVAPELTVTLGRTMEEAKARHLRSGIVAHRRSLHYTERQIANQIEVNLIGPPDVVMEKIDRLSAVGVDHCAALIFPTDTMEEMVEQIQWFGEDVVRRSTKSPL